MGIAGGVDKNAQNITGWTNFGAGYIEVGTITPLPQTPNPGKIIDRNQSSKALWNKMGFPSEGLDKALKNIKNQKNKIPLFANIGKNRNTPNEDAHNEYILLVSKLISYVDGFVINISSPNTKGLRFLLDPENLEKFLKPIIAERNKYCNDLNLPKRPVLLKLSPNMDNEDFLKAVDTSIKAGVDGWILTNTTTDYSKDLGFSTDGGGVSGEPLSERSVELLKSLCDYLPKEIKDSKIIVSSGGILNSDQVNQRLDMGANLVQFYSALIFQGPWFFQQVALS